MHPLNEWHYRHPQQHHHHHQWRRPSARLQLHLTTSPHLRLLTPSAPVSAFHLFSFIQLYLHWLNWLHLKKVLLQLLSIDACLSARNSDNRIAHKVTSPILILSQGLSAQRTINLLLLANKSDINERSMASHWALSIDVIVLKVNEWVYLFFPFLSLANTIVFAQSAAGAVMKLIANYELPLAAHCILSRPPQSSSPAPAPLLLLLYIYSYNLLVLPAHLFCLF